MVQYSKKNINQVRSMALSDALTKVGIRCFKDTSFAPIKNQKTEMLIVDDIFEITVTGEKFVARRRGSRKIEATGGGAIDLVMCVKRVPFLDAVRLLNQ